MWISPTAIHALLQREQKGTGLKMGFVVNHNLFGSSTPSNVKGNDWKNYFLYSFRGNLTWDTLLSSTVVFDFHFYLGHFPAW